MKKLLDKIKLFFKNKRERDDIKEWLDFGSPDKVVRGIKIDDMILEIDDYEEKLLTGMERIN